MQSRCGGGDPQGLDHLVTVPCPVAGSSAERSWVHPPVDGAAGTPARGGCGRGRGRSRSNAGTARRGPGTVSRPCSFAPSRMKPSCTRSGGGLVVDEPARHLDQSRRPRPRRAGRREATTDSSRPTGSAGSVVSTPSSIVLITLRTDEVGRRVTGEDGFSPLCTGHPVDARAPSEGCTHISMPVGGITMRGFTSSIQDGEDDRAGGVVALHRGGARPRPRVGCPGPGLDATDQHGSGVPLSGP